MPVIEGQEGTFDTAAKLYEKFRPGYPNELYETIFDYIPIGASSRAVEIGIGAGQATLAILKTGCDITAVECGENFTRICRDKFKEYNYFRVINEKFETVELPSDTYDLVYSASAFHWIPEEIGYTKAYSILKPGGAFIRFANHPFRDPRLEKEIDQVYAEYYYPYYGRKPEKIHAYDEEQAKEKARLASKYGFTDIRYDLFHRERIFSAGDYVNLLGTYSDHISIEKSVRDKFFSQIRSVIEQHGGYITLYDTIDIQLARKP